MRGLLVLVLCILFTGLSGCNSDPSRSGSIENRDFDLRSLGKSDISGIIDLHVRLARDHLETLMVKLYKRNPRELHKHAGANVHDRIQQVFEYPPRWNFPELQGKLGTDCISLAFSEEYQGDRVLAYMVGLTSMLMASYGHKIEFYMFDSLEPQKLYNSARNIEIAVWKLSNNRDAQGELFILSNSQAGEEANLSFERLFGKLISLQDSIALIIDDGTNRIIKSVIQKMATAVFLPV